MSEQGTFGSLAGGLSTEMAVQQAQANAVDRIAKVCHEANAALCRAFGDDSQLPWDKAPGWQVASAKEGVMWRQENPDAPVAAQHNQWTIDKTRNGWIYGAEKNEGLKTHPCLVPFDDLPPDQKAKDYLFAGIVMAMTGS